jgi:nucleotide-binding universal stress UspA family protein
MSIRRIALHLEPAMTPRHVEALDVAVRTAAAMGARLSVLLWGTSTDDLPADMPESEEQVATARAQVEAAAASGGVAVEVFGRSSYAYGIGEVFADHLKVADLGFFPVGAAFGAAQKAMLGAAVFNSGCPVIVLPAKAGWPTQPQRILVGWDASEASARALRATLPFAAGAREIIIAAVSPERSVRLDQSGIAATQHVAAHGGSATFRQMPGDRTGALASLLRTAADVQADLMVVGAVRHSPLRDMILGGVTFDLMGNVPPRAVMMVA